MHLPAILPWQILRAIQASSSMGDLGESMGEMSWGKGEFGSDDRISRNDVLLYVIYIYLFIYSDIYIVFYMILV